MDLLVFFGKNMPSLEYNGNHPDVIKGLDDWQSAATEDQLKDAAMRTQAAWAEQLTNVPIVTSNAVWVHRKSVHGFVPSQTMLYPLFNDVWIEK